MPTPFGLVSMKRTLSYSSGWQAEMVYCLAAGDVAAHIAAHYLDQPYGARSNRPIGTAPTRSPRSFDRSSSAVDQRLRARSSRLPPAKLCNASLSI